MPRLAQFAAPASMGDGKNHATGQQAQPVGVEANWDGDAVAAVPIKQERSGPVARSALLVHHRERNLGAVPGASKEAFADVLRRVIIAQDRLLLAQELLARTEVVVEHGARSDEGFVSEANVIGNEFRIRAESGIVNGLAEREATRGGEGVVRIGRTGGWCNIERDDAEMWKRV